jgi:hypothetical protein
MEHGTDDAGLRAEVLRRLEREAAHWDDTAGPAPAPAARTTGAEPVPSPPAARSEIRPDVRQEALPEVAPVAEPARHGRPGRRISVRWHPRA